MEAVRPVLLHSETVEQEPLEKLQAVRLMK